VLAYFLACALQEVQHFLLPSFLPDTKYRCRPSEGEVRSALLAPEGQQR